jgi:hypothetical protein
MNKKVKIDLVGGVGNQLFIYFAGLYLSVKKEKEFKPRILKPSFGDSKHSSKINALNIEPKVISLSFTHTHLLRLIEKFTVLIASNFPKLKPILRSKTYISSVVGYDENLEKTTKNVIRGYFQTFKYIDWLADSNLVSLEIAPESPSQWFTQMSRDVTESVTIGIHVRGGDYLLPVNAEIGNLSPEYYNRALQRVSEILNLSHFQALVFTDDLVHATALLGKINTQVEFKYINPPADSQATESMLLLSKCSIKIISNSTFAWWAGYLGDSTELVLAPSKWFKGMIDPDEIKPSEWETCESDWLETTTNRNGIK